MIIRRPKGKERLTWRFPRMQIPAAGFESRSSRWVCSGLPAISEALVLGPCNSHLTLVPANPQMPVSDGKRGSGSALHYPNPNLVLLGLGAILCGIQPRRRRRWFCLNSPLCWPKFGTRCAERAELLRSPV